MKNGYPKKVVYRILYEGETTKQHQQGNKATDYANVFPRNHSNITNNSNDGLNQILAYYEKNKDQLKADLDNKLVVIKNNRIYIKQQAIREIIAILENQKNQENYSK